MREQPRATHEQSQVGPDLDPSSAEHLDKKREQWNRKMNEMLEPDVYGYVLDEGIRDVVVALQLLDFNTTQSDQGNRGGLPWVEVMANYPVDVYEGEAELKARLMAERAIRPEEIDPASSSFSRAKQVEIEGDAQDELARAGAPYTSDYNEWRTKTLDSVDKLQKIVDEFNLTHPGEQPGDMRVGIEFPYRTANHSYPERIQDIPNLTVLFNEPENSGSSEEERRNLSIHARQEMDRFSNFLKDRYFTSR